MPEENKMGSVPEKKLLLSMALPMMISMLVQALYNIVDSAFVARISEKALAAVSLAFPVQLIMISVATGIGVGINALISRKLGQGQAEEASQTAMNGIFLSVCCWILFAVLGFLFSDAFLSCFTSDAEIIAMGTAYLRICTGFSCGIFLLFATERLMQATGNTVFHMITQLFSALLNCVLDPIFIFGLWGMPKLGVSGAALATVLSQILAMLFGFFINLRFNKQITLSLHAFRFDGMILKEMLRIGMPAMLQQSLMSFLTIGLNHILGAFSITAINFYGIYFKLQNFLFMPIYGLNNALIPIIGFNYGAKNPNRILNTTRFAIFIAVCIMLLGTAFFFFFPQLLLGLFHAGPEMLSFGCQALRILSFSFCFSAVSIVLCGFLQGLGDSFSSLLIAMMRQCIILLPLAFFLSKISLSALWWAFPVAECIGMLTAVLLYRSISNKRFQSVHTTTKKTEYT